MVLENSLLDPLQNSFTVSVDTLHGRSSYNGQKPRTQSGHRKPDSGKGL